MTSKKVLSMVGLCLLAVLTCSTVFGQSAGGSISGTVTDPKGAVVVAAVVTVTSSPSGQSYSAKTDQKGRFNVGNLAAGMYTVTIDAPGFVEQKRENLTVAEGKPSDASAQLEITPVEGTVSVDIGNVKPNQDATYRKLRQDSGAPDSFSGEFATVNNLVLKRDAGTFTLKTGEIYFLAPVEGRTVGAVFLGEGEFQLTPPTETEKNSLAIFTDSPGITEKFTQLVLRFTDQTRDEVSQSPQVKMGRGGAQEGKARDEFREKETVFRKELRTNLDLRTLWDLYAPPRPGFFIAIIGGKRFNKLIYDVDPLGLGDAYPEEVELRSYGETDGGIWTAFHLADEYAKHTASNSQERRLYDIHRHEIDAVIKGMRLTAVDRVSFSPMIPGERVIPFDLYPSLRVTRVTDESGANLDFVQQDKNEHGDFAVILPQAGEVGRWQKLTIEYAGDGAIADSGGGNYFLGPRSTWYPNNPNTSFGDRATFDLIFHYPKGDILVGVGSLAEPEKKEDDAIWSHWTSGSVELQVAGFNYGRFVKKAEDDPESGYGVEFYANKELPAELRIYQQQIEAGGSVGGGTGGGLGAMSTTSMASPAIHDAESSLRIYNSYFGKLPYTRIAMSQQPAIGFGQAWPTLVFMPYAAFLDDTTRVQLFGGMRGGTDSFWTYVAPHEISHQWWGHAIGWASYHDQWMSEGFAEFSTSLYAQYVRRDLVKFNALWEIQRNLITQASQSTNGRKPYTVGPVTQGYRLNNGKTGNVTRVMIYPKGAYILHMIRMLMMDPRSDGDAKFVAMMKDFVQSHLNQDVSTEDFKRMVEKHMTPAMDIDKNMRMNWFFDEWVYGTEVPAYKLEYQISSTSDGKATFSGTITQSGVGKNFVMAVPIYLDFGKGWVRLGAATLSGNSTYEIPPVKLAEMPKKATLCALSDVLYTDLTVTKH